jgi:tetratricopeptide (TPR) repeat protein
MSLAKRAECTILMPIFIVLIIVISCAKEEEVIFKAAVKKLDYLLLCLEKIPPEKVKETLTPEKGVIIVMNTNEGAKYIEERKEEWKRIEEDLWKVRDQYPGSKWSDDALFCLSLKYMMLVNRGEGEFYSNKAVNTMKEFISLREGCKIENWTKKTLKRSFWNRFENELKRDIYNEEEEIKALFHLFIGNQLLRRRDYEDAIEEYKKIINNYPHSIFSEQAKLQIEICRKGDSFFEGITPREKDIKR